MPWIILGIIISYLLGSVPFAYIFGRLLKGVDIRQHGSGNVGATNAFRVLGKGPAVLVLLLDILKGFIALVFVGDLVASKGVFIPIDSLRVILGLACISGHNWTIFLGFKGGKGVATTIGVLIGLALKVTGLNLVLAFVGLIWLAVFLLSRIVSLASVLAAIALPLFAFFFKQSQTILIASFILSAFLIFRHKSNLSRILQGKEKRLF